MLDGTQGRGATRPPCPSVTERTDADAHPMLTHNLEGGDQATLAQRRGVTHPGSHSKVVRVGSVLRIPKGSCYMAQNIPGAGGRDPPLPSARAMSWGSRKNMGTGLANEGES